jgi:cold-inducible RNA-binding protein
MGNTLFVGNLSYQTTEDDLVQLFMQVGPVASVSIIRKRETGRSRGFAFVEMATEEEAQRAQSMFNGQKRQNRTLRVELARPRGERPASDGGGEEGRGDRGENPPS